MELCKKKDSLCSWPGGTFFNWIVRNSNEQNFLLEGICATLNLRIRPQR